MKLSVLFLLDRSGSMQSIKSDAIGGFNNYVETLARENPKSTITLITFDTMSVDTVIDNQPVTKAEPLTDRTYEPRGGTPLLDAIGGAVDVLTKASGKNKALVILTDGQENSSREYTKDAVRKLLDEKQEKDNWLIIYLGANQDSFHEASQLGIGAGTAMNFAANSAGIRGTMASAADSTIRYAAGGNRNKAVFTKGERQKGMGQ